MASWQQVDDVVGPLTDRPGEPTLPAPRDRAVRGRRDAGWTSTRALVDLARNARRRGPRGPCGHRCAGPSRPRRRSTSATAGRSAPRYVIAADGMWSPLRKLLGPATAGYRGEWHAFRQYFDGRHRPAAARELFVLVRARSAARLRLVVPARRRPGQRRLRHPTWRQDRRRRHEGRCGRTCSPDPTSRAVLGPDAELEGRATGPGRSRPGSTGITLAVGPRRCSSATRSRPVIPSPVRASARRCSPASLAAEAITPAGSRSTPRTGRVSQPTSAAVRRRPRRRPPDVDAADPGAAAPQGSPGRDSDRRRQRRGPAATSPAGCSRTTPGPSAFTPRRWHRGMFTRSGRLSERFLTGPDHAAAAGSPTMPRHAHETDRDPRGRAPRDAGRHGRRVVPPARGRRVRGGGLRLSRRLHDGPRARWCREIAAVRGLTDQPFGVDLLTAAPQDMPAKVQDIIDGGASVFVAGLGVPRDVIDLCHEQDVLVVNMCGKVRHASRRGRGRLRHRRRPGHRGRGPHRPGGDHGARAPDRRRGRRTSPGGRRWWSVRRPWPGRRPRRSAPTASGSAPASSPRPRPSAVPGYKERDRSTATRTARSSPGPTPARPAGSCVTATPRTSSDTGGAPEPFPGQVLKSMRTAPTTSAATRPPQMSTRTASSCPPVRASARSPSWCPAADLVAPIRRRGRGGARQGKRRHRLTGLADHRHVRFQRGRRRLACVPSAKDGDVEGAAAG